MLTNQPKKFLDKISMLLDTYVLPKRVKKYKLKYNVGANIFVLI